MKHEQLKSGQGGKNVDRPRNSPVTLKRNKKPTNKKHFFPCSQTLIFYVYTHASWKYNNNWIIYMIYTSGRRKRMKISHILLLCQWEISVCIIIYIVYGDDYILSEACLLFSNMFLTVFLTGILLLNLLSWQQYFITAVVGLPHSTTGICWDNIDTLYGIYSW